MVRAVTDGDDLLPLEVEEFLSWLVTERGRAANTILAYRRDLGAYAVWLAHHGADLGSVDTATLVDFVAERRAGGAAASSVARQLAAIRMLHRYLVTEGERPDDPTADLEGVRVPAGLPKPLSEPEVTSLLDAVVGHDPVALRDRALLELLYATGARISEIVGLDVDGVSDRTAVRLLGKGAKERAVPVGSFARDALEGYLVRSRPALAAAGRGTPALFLNTRGARMSRQTAWAALQAAAARAGLKEHVSPHTLRHSFATHLLSGGADVRVVQELLGHASVTTTQIYTMVTPDALREVYAAAHPRAR